MKDKLWVPVGLLEWDALFVGSSELEDDNVHDTLRDAEEVKVHELETTEVSLAVNSLDTDTVRDCCCESVTDRDSVFDLDPVGCML